MRKLLEPDWETAEKLYPTIKVLIEKYTEYCDENDDTDLIEYGKLENKLCEMTGKNISEYNLSEWWESEGLEVLSFRVALPNPNVVPDISKEELLEIINRIKLGDSQQSNDDSFQDTFNLYIDSYYRELLKLNFKKYNLKYFNRQKGKDGNYFEYTAEEISEKIWN